METSTFSTSLDDLGDALRATGFPYNGLSPVPAKEGQPIHFTEGGVGYFVQLHIPPEATQNQVDQLTSIRDLFLILPRKTRPRAELLAAVQALTSTQRNQLLVAMIVDFLEHEPDFVSRLGINLEGDAPV